LDSRVLVEASTGQASTAFRMENPYEHDPHEHPRFIDDEIPEDGQKKQLLHKLAPRREHHLGSFTDGNMVK
jgi:hypothetical protein